MTHKLAVPLADNPSVVLLDNGERMSRRSAAQAGYRIADAATLARADVEASRANVLPAWRAQVSLLPEAQARPSAVARLIEEQPLMSIDRVRAFLRGLPAETEQTDTTEETMTTNDDPRAARLAEINGSMSAFNKDKGWSTSQPQPIGDNLDAAKLKRLAEIEVSTAAFNKSRGYTSAKSQPALKRLAETRLNELTASGQGRSHEAKSLKLAIDAHNATGAPLDRSLAQLGVDTSTFVRNV